MSVTNVTAFSSATGNGTNKVFSFAFRVQATSEVQVYVDNVLQVSGYTVALTKDANGRPTGRRHGHVHRGSGEQCQGRYRVLPPLHPARLVPELGLVPSRDP
jgi:hypothetical protein